MSQSPASQFYQTVAPPPTQRQEDLLLNSHILAYESLVGTLTKQVLAQQEQLSELRSVIMNNSAAHNTSIGFNTSSQVQPTYPQDPVAGLVSSPAPQHQTPAVARGRQEEDLLRRLEPLICQSLSEHFYNAEERIAASLADRIRRITKEHVMRSVDREIRHVMRDAVVESCAQQVMSSNRYPQQPIARREIESTNESQGAGGERNRVSSSSRTRASRSSSGPKKATQRSVDTSRESDVSRNHYMDDVEERQRLVAHVSRHHHEAQTEKAGRQFRAERNAGEEAGLSSFSQPQAPTTASTLAQFASKRDSENRLLQEMDQLRAKLEDLERRSASTGLRDVSTGSRRQRSSVNQSTSTLYGGTTNSDRLKRNPYADQSPRNASHESSHHQRPENRRQSKEGERRHGARRSPSSSSSASASSASPSTLSSSVHRRFSGTSAPRGSESPPSLRNVDRDVDHLMQAFRDLSRGSQQQLAH